MEQLNRVKEQLKKKILPNFHKLITSCNNSASLDQATRKFIADVVGVV
jgi:hypothetical protein